MLIGHLTSGREICYKSGDSVLFTLHSIEGWDKDEWFDLFCVCHYMCFRSDWRYRLDVGLWDFWHRLLSGLEKRLGAKTMAKSKADHRLCGILDLVLRGSTMMDESLKI